MRKKSGAANTPAHARRSQGRGQDKTGELPWYKLALTGTFFALLAGAAIMQRLAWQILPAYLLLSMLGYGAYYLDKRAARRGQWRISETRLHLISLLGGWPGALLAQSRLRHKHGKPAFMLVFWCTVAVNLGLLAWAISVAISGRPAIPGAF